jgi:hypothetical protein
VADGVNSSGKPKNGVIPKTLQEIEAERERRLAQINERRQSGHKDISEAIGSLKEDLTYASNAQERLKVIEQISASSNLRERVNGRADEDIATQSGIMADRISTYTKERNVNERTTTMSSSAKYFKEAKNNPMLSIPTEVLEQRIAGGIGSINTMGSELGEEVRGSRRALGQDFYNKAQQISNTEEEVALLKRVKSQQSRSGLSTEKIYNTFGDTLSSGREGLNVLGDRRIIDAVKGGKHGTLEEETDKLKSTLDKLEKTFSDYQESSEKYAQDQTDANKKLLDASLDKLKADEKAVEDQKKIVRATDVYGGRGGASGLGDKFEQGANIAKSVVGGIGGMMVDDQISEMRLKAAAGQTAVTQFNRVNAGIGGDMRSLLAETSSAAFVKDFSDSMRSRQLAVSVGEVGADAAGTIGTGLKAGAEGFLKGGKVGAIKEGVSAASGEAINTVRKGYQVGIGLPQTVKAMEAWNAGEQFAGVSNEIKAQMLQAVYDQSQAGYNASIGAGGAAGAIESTLTDNFYLKSMAEQGMSPGQSAQLTALAVGAVGGDESKTSLALKAAKAQSRGLTSAEQFIGMAGQMSGAGGTGADLESIMAKAVEAGVGNAKNIQQMVSATVALSSNMAKSGIAGASASGNLLAGMVGDLTKGGMDPNVAMISAESQLQLRSQMDSTSGMQIGDIHKFKELKKAFPTASTVQLDVMSTLTQEQLQALSENPAEAKKMGLGSQIKTSKDANTIGGINTEGLKFNVGIGTFGKTDEDAQALMYKAGLSNGITNQVGRTVKGQESETTDSQAFAQRQVKAARDAEFVQAGAGKDINETLRGLTTVMETLAKNLSPDKAQDNVETAMKDMKGVGPVLDSAGKSLSEGAGQFKQAVAEFNKVLKSADLGSRQVSIPTSNNSDASKAPRKR